ncbi:hypothetical protein PR002_g15821 [Phytophthora rubi]|uniref:Uncharacterized protein n=1 Tax=Phytophthora rubi TaxID=129364 RepID=A0A6A3KSW5_9STRA|nr:hypothetical protein PR002_g15821 [Phytophthora rubi]
MPYSPSLAGIATSILVTELAVNWAFFTTLTAATRAPPDSPYVRKGITTARSSSRYRTPPLAEVHNSSSCLHETPNKNSFVQPSTTHASTVTCSPKTVIIRNRHTPITSRKKKQYLRRNPPDCCTSRAASIRFLQWCSEHRCLA